MNILGIIAEFNPLHTGHTYLIQNLRRETAADYCIAVMSGDYVQRGEPAFFSKYLRAKAALLSGIDLVIELPLSVSTGSAEYFAEGAVSLLNKLGCVTHLGFGSESGDICAFENAGKILSELSSDEPDAYRALLRQFLKEGMHFPKARYEALLACFPSGPLSHLDAPNNILGAEYCKALHTLRSPITPVTLKRVGAGYHEEANHSCTPFPQAPVPLVTAQMSHEEASYTCTSFPQAPVPLVAAQTSHEEASHTCTPFSQTDCGTAQDYASASGLRKAFLASPHSPETKRLIQAYVPHACRPLYLEALQAGQYVTFDKFFLPLYHTLQYADAETLSRCQDVAPEFAERLLHLFRQASSTEELCALLKTKNITSARINRSLLHILLHLTKDAAAAEKEQGYALYARILGFREDAKPLLSLLSGKASVPLVSKLADAGKILPPPALAQLELTKKASELYCAVMPCTVSGSENARNIVIVSPS